MAVLLPEIESTLIAAERWLAGHDERVAAKGQARHAKIIAAHEKRKAEEVRRRNKEEAEAAAYRCRDNPKECRTNCEADHSSDDCFGLAAIMHAGVSVPKDPAGARRLAQRSCDVGSSQACEAIRVFDAVEAKRKKKVDAERKLPTLFAQCNQYRLRIQQLKAARDFDGLKKLEPDWSQNIDDINEAIELVTGNDGPRRQEMLKKFQRCSGGRNRW